MKYKVTLIRTVVEVTDVYVQADCPENAENAADAAVNDDTKWHATDAASWSTMEIEEL